MTITQQLNQPADAATQRRRALAALWTMTRAERIEAMWAGRLNLIQLAAWSAHAPEEVPRIGGELAWIVIRTPEWADE